MNGYLLDTNCISELVRIRPEPRVQEWIASVDERALFLSVLTIGEIKKGVAGLAQDKRKLQLENWLLQLKLRFAERVLPIDEEIADHWGQLSATAKSQGKVLAVIDGLLAATALQHNLVIATRNVDDFAATPVLVHNPWSQAN